jgi:hypothetical protein
MYELIFTLNDIDLFTSRVANLSFAIVQFNVHIFSIKASIIKRIELGRCVEVFI